MNSAMKPRKSLEQRVKVLEEDHASKWNLERAIDRIDKLERAPVPLSPSNQLRLWMVFGGYVAGLVLILGVPIAAMYGAVNWSAVWGGGIGGGALLVASFLGSFAQVEK